MTNIEYHEHEKQNTENIHHCPMPNDTYANNISIYTT